MKQLAAVGGRVLPRGPFARSVLTIATGTGIAQVIVIATSPILTRLYAPDAYGVFSVAMSIIMILLSISSLRYQFAIPLPESDDAAANILALSLAINAAMSVLAGAALWLGGSTLLPLLGAATLAPYVMVIALGQLGAGTVSALENWAVRTRAFADLAATRMTQAVVLVVMQVGMGAAGFGASGLLLGDIAGRFGGGTRLARGAWRTHSRSFRRVSWRGVASAASRYRRFALVSSPSILLYSVASRAPLLLLVAIYGIEAGGQYALADRVCSLPLSLVAGAVGQVYLSEAAELARNEPAALRRLFWRTTRSMARLAILPAIVLGLAAALFAGLVFGGAWTQMGIFVAILAPMYYVTFVVSATGDTLFVVERLDLQLAREVIRLVLLGGAVPLAAMLKLPVEGAIVTLSIAGCLAFLAHGCISWVSIDRHGRPRTSIYGGGEEAAE